MNDCANKEKMGGTGLCDGRAMYCHTCVDAATRVCNNALAIARERLEAALLQVRALQIVLAKIEWVYEISLKASYCPMCENDDTTGHTDDCEIPKALAVDRPCTEKPVVSGRKCGCPCHDEIKKLGYGFPCGVDECAPCGEEAARHGLTGE